MNHIGTDKLAEAAPIHRARMMELLSRCTEAGIRILVVFTYRSLADQFKIYMEGRTYNPVTKTFRVVGDTRTKALPGKSSHNVVDALYGTPASLATDIVPASDKGKPLWDTPPSVWLKIYEICNKKCGLDAYGDRWGKELLWDKGHMEEPMPEVIMGSLGLKYPEFNLEQHVKSLI